MPTQKSLLALLAFVLLLNPAGRLLADELFVAFWNVENLFDTVDDPAVEGDEEFTPQGPKHWTDERFRTKLRNLVRVLCDANGGKGPDILGLAEVENRQVVQSLATELDKLGRKYRIVHRDSPSGRGIDCALLYDSNRVRLLDSRFLPVAAVATREIVEARFEFLGSPFHLFVNHWPSKGNPESARIKAAITLRRRIDALFAVNERVDLVVIGDLNELPHEQAVAKTLRTWGDPKSLAPKVLFNSTWQLHREGRRGTYVYKDRWEVIDHVILSQGLLGDSGLRWKAGSTHPLQQDYQMFHPRFGIPRPSRSYSGNSFHADGFSDHLPIACILEQVE
jgi:predicted extracellular nuclease